MEVHWPDKYKYYWYMHIETLSSNNKQSVRLEEKDFQLHNIFIVVIAQFQIRHDR